ncbi:hypothetical protein [Xanthobacter wiegelii]|uniref:hypothetical protein n=1 Tax=Xanthobacter wiegelii TaxID=3119913 RepID=UPI0037281F45
MSNKLKAVNRCLRAIGEAPVNSLSSGVPDAEVAMAVLDDVTEEVLEVGWHCNTRREVRLLPDVNGQIAVPSDYLQVDTVGTSANIDVTVSKDPQDDIIKLFNITEQTYEFSGPVYVDVILRLDYEGLPLALRNYIAAKSARVFQENQMGSTSLDAFTSRAESEAWAKLQDYEAEVEDANCLTDSAYMRYVRYRNSPISGI